MSKEAQELYKEIRAFTLWADKNYPDWSEEHDNGEWEFGVCSHFDEMSDAAREVVVNVDCNDADEELIAALLFAVARDNECENLAEELTKYAGWFELLAKESINSKYVNATWQFAKRIGKVEGCKELIFEFIESDHEYISRMALQAMAYIYPERAEEYAIRFWNRGKYKEGSYEDEYQKIMALHVLDKISSSKLEEYVNKALMSKYVYLRKSAAEIRGVTL